MRTTPIWTRQYWLETTRTRYGPKQILERVDDDDDDDDEEEEEMSMSKITDTKEMRRS